MNALTIRGQQKRHAVLVSLDLCQTQLHALSIIIASAMILVGLYDVIAAQRKEIQSRGILIIINLTAEIFFPIWKYGVSDKNHGDLLEFTYTQTRKMDSCLPFTFLQISEHQKKWSLCNAIRGTFKICIQTHPSF